MDYSVAGQDLVTLHAPGRANAPQTIQAPKLNVDTRSVQHPCQWALAGPHP